MNESDNKEKDIEIMANKIILHVGVKTNAPKNQIYYDNGGALIIKVRAPPTKGKANKEIINYLKDLSEMEVKIIQGKKSKNKIIQCSKFAKKDLTINDFKKKLGI